MLSCKGDSYKEIDSHKMLIIKITKKKYLHIRNISLQVCIMDFDDMSSILIIIILIQIAHTYCIYKLYNTTLILSIKINTELNL